MKHTFPNHTPVSVKEAKEGAKYCANKGGHTTWTFRLCGILYNKSKKTDCQSANIYGL
jgi:hypothetical protein